MSTQAAVKHHSREVRSALKEAGRMLEETGITSKSRIYTAGKRIHLEADLNMKFYPLISHSTLHVCIPPGRCNGTMEVSFGLQLTESGQRPDKPRHSYTHLVTAEVEQVPAHEMVYLFMVALNAGISQMMPFSTMAQPFASSRMAVKPASREHLVELTRLLGRAARS